MTLQLKLIAAACENMGIGYKNKLPWKLRKEMDYFTRMTTQTVDPEKHNAVIMGRQTWQSIPQKMRPLQNRINIVLSRQLREPPDSAHYLANCFEECLQLLQGPLLSNTVESVWVIGGEQIYREAMECPLCELIYLTRIKAVYECDTFFPLIPMDKFELYSWCLEVIELALLGKWNSLMDYAIASNPLKSAVFNRDLNVPDEVQEESGIQYKYEVYKRKISAA